MVSAISDRLLRLKPNIYMNPKVPSSEIGTASEGTSVAHGSRRNANTTSTTRKIAITSVASTSCSEERIVVERSIATETSIDDGIEASSSGSSARTLSTVSMMLAPGWREMMISTAGLLLARPALRIFSTESTTSPRSDSRTGAPLR